MRDLRYALRGLAKSKSFTLITLASLALGIGANAAIFQLIDALTLRPLPVARPDELAFVRVGGQTASLRSGYGDTSNPVFEQVRDAQQAFSRVAAFEDCNYLLGRAGEAHWAPGLCVSGGFYETLAVPPLLGRVFGPADDQKSCTALIAVVGYDFWQRELAGDPAVIGRQIDLDQLRYEIVGVTPPGFTGPMVGKAVDVSVPLCLDEMYGGGTDHSLDESWTYNLTVIGRLRQGWSMARAGSHLAAISPAIMEATVPPARIVSAADAARYRAGRLEASPAATGLSALRDRYSDSLWLLLAIAVSVLLIACANLANLLLARASAREREIAVRLALGASRGQLVQQLMIESVLLAAAGAALGLLLATVLSPIIVDLLPDPRSIVVDLSPDWRVIVFTAVVATSTCLLFGLWPALRASRADVGLVLKAAAGHATDGRERFGLRRLLVAAQVACSFVLLVGALLFLRSLQNLVGVEPGFRIDSLTRAIVDLDPLRHDPYRWEAAEGELAEKIRALPGVDAAAFAGGQPFHGRPYMVTVLPDRPDPTLGTQVALDRVGPGDFATLDIPLLAGRDFDAADRVAAPEVAVVNQRLARTLFGDANPVGHTFWPKTNEGSPGRPIRIVGLVGDAHVDSLRGDILPLVYLARAQGKIGARFQLDVRSNLPPARLRETIVGLALAASPSAILSFSTFDAWRRESLGSERLMATLAGIFGGLATLLAAAGLYGVFSYSVSRRSREIAIRMALGADGSRVGRMVLLEAVWLLAGGLAVGVILALAATRTVAAMLFGLAPHDPLTFVAAAMLLAAVAVVAGLPAARRAARVDPMVILRDD